MKYVAFIRGIGPVNPNMRGEKLTWFFHELGFTHVQTVLGSGNVIFESDEADQSKLENKIEENLPKKLQFQKAVFVRSHTQLQKLFDSDPFHGMDDLPTSRLNVSFLKNGGEVFSVIDTKGTGTLEIMSQLEKKYGKEMTMRTWKTLGKILERME